MPDQFVVPQFIDAEDQIIGPITVRQFVILMIGGLTEFVLFKLCSFTIFLAVGIPLFAITGTLAFLRINGMPFHFFILNLIQTARKPVLRVWNKELTNEELKRYMNEKPPEIPVPEIKKRPLSGSRLQELTLVVDTGGVYQPEDETS